MDSLARRCELLRLRVQQTCVQYWLHWYLWGLWSLVLILVWCIISNNDLLPDEQFDTLFAVVCCAAVGLFGAVGVRRTLRHFTRNTFRDDLPADGPIGQAQHATHTPGR